MSLHPLLDNAMSEGVFPITKRLAIGQFATEQRCKMLIAHSVTHILNVSDAESLSFTRDRFSQVRDVAIDDLTPIPFATASSCIETIHEAMSSPNSKLYIHCIAGQNRSPTILWLYLVALGMQQGIAKQLIVQRAPDAVPGHTSLVNAPYD